MLPSEVFSKVFLPDKREVSMHILSSQQNVVWHQRMWEARERELWLEEYACEWGNGSIAKGQGE